MFKSGRLRNAVVTGLLVLFAATGVWAESSKKSASSDELLRLVPAESLFCVRVNNFDYALGMMDQFLAGASPMPMGISMMARMQLAGALGEPALNNVNMSGNFAIFAVTLPGESTETNPIANMFIAGLIPITNFQKFVSDNPNCVQPDANGVSKITTSDISGASKTTLITQLGSYALISSANNYDKLVAMAKSISADKAAGLASALDAAETKLARNEPLWAYGNVQQASKTFGPMVFGKIEQTKTMMENMKSSGQGTIGPPAATMNMYAGILETLMKEVQFLSLIVKPKPNVCNVTVSASAVPGTDIANMFVADASAGKENKLLGYLEDGAMMNFACKMNTPFWKKLNDKCIDLFAAIAGESMTVEDIAKMKTLATDMISALGGSMACSFSTDEKNKPPFAFKYVVEVKDSDKFNKVIEEATEMVNTGGVADFYKKMDMETSFAITRGADNYKGVPIDSSKLAMKSTDPNSPQGQMINAMYSGGFDYRWAIVNGLCVWAIGGDADSAIRQLIDQVKAGGPKQIAAEIKAALTLLTEADKADFMGTYNYVRLFKMATALMPTANTMSVAMPQMDIPTKSNIAFAGKVGGGKLTVDIALPKEHLMEITTALQMMQQKMMQMQEQPTIQQEQKGKGPMGETAAPANSPAK